MNNLPEDFDWKIYLELNSDVKKHTESKTAAIQHYLIHGFKENRIYNKKNLPNDFDWKEYLKLNPDVQKNAFTKNEAINHYLKYGIKENRKYQIIKECDSEAIKLDLEKTVHDLNVTENQEKEIELELFDKDFDFNIDDNDDDDWDSDYNDLIEILDKNNIDNNLITNVIEHNLVGILSEALSEIL